ncbi:Transmembrane protein 66 [Pyrenophora tritici-repentis]|nr:Transmembrane protein 66 [Pyrenophora tritici-repentis]
MHLVSFLYPALLAASGADALRSDKVKLSNIQSLTLRKGLQTSARRVDPIPQLKCVGGSARGLYEPEVMRCKNSGSDYDENSIQWTCTASLPEEFKLGSTDVICEGYDYPEDPYILKGSCGVEYRLILTDRGREKYGKGGGWSGDDDDRPDGPRTTGEKIAGVLFWMLFGGVVLWMIYSALRNRAQGPDGVPGPNNPNNPKSGYGTNQGWRPGFWSGAAGGAAAGWAAGQFANRGNRSNQTGGWRDGNGSGSRWNNGGEGNSRSSSGDSFSSTRHESTGFGGTSRR